MLLKSTMVAETEELENPSQYRCQEKTNLRDPEMSIKDLRSQPIDHKKMVKSRLHLRDHLLSLVRIVSRKRISC